MKKRIITGVIMILVIVPLIIFSELLIGFQILFGALTIFGSLELLNMYNSNYSLKVKIIVPLLSLLTYLTLAVFKISHININILSKYGLIMIFNSFILLLLTIVDEEFSGDNFSKFLSTISYVGLGLGSLVLVRMIDVRFLIILILTTTLTDVFAYTFGMNFGKHKMAPNISPNKSWEGAIGGTIVAVTLVSLLGIFYGNVFSSSFLNEYQVKTILDNVPNLANLNKGLKYLVIVVIVLAISVMGQLGDLIASKMKRVYEIKDFGNIFPGHGGVLDRFDSAIFSSMFLLLILTTLTIF